MYVNQDDVAAELFALESCDVVGAVVSASAVAASPGCVVVNCGSSSTASSQSSSEDLAKIRDLQQRLRRAKRKIDGLKGQVACIGSDSRMKHQKRPYVGTLVSLMRNRHHGSADSASAWANLFCPEYSLSRLSVCRWELKVGSSVLAAMAAFIQSHEAQLRSYRDDTSQWHASITELIGDATKYCCWREHKVQCLQVKQTYLLGSSCESRECWPDIQAVRDATGPGCCEMVNKKQLRIIQCPALDTRQSNDLGQKQVR